MNKKELIHRVSKITGRTKIDTGTIIDATLNEIKNELRNDEPISIRDFGMFESITMKSRKGLTPSGLDCYIPERSKVKFRPSKNFLKE